MRSEAVEMPQVGAESAGGQAQQDGHRQGDPGQLVHPDHQFAAADEFGELGDVEEGGRDHAHAHQGGRAAVHPALDGAEPPYLGDLRGVGLSS